MPNQHRCNSTTVGVMEPGAADQSVPARFRQVAQAHAGCLAVQDERWRLTYRDLDGLANGIAWSIVTRCGDAREPVVLLFHQGVPSVAATLGALAAGRPYVPLDPSDPPVYLSEIADRVGARLVLTDGESASAADALRGPGREVLTVDPGTTGSADPPRINLTPECLAYVYFTSGSTGTPKGVLDTHRNILHNVMRYTSALGIGPADRLSLLQSPSFSGVVSSTFAALLNGAALFPMRSGGDRMNALAAEVRERRITLYHSTPSIFRSLVAVDGGVFSDVRTVRLEGDRASSLDVELHRRHFPPSSILANGLGTTETGLCRQLRVSAADPAPEGILPVGYPVLGVDVDVVDAAGRPLLVGEAGEIVVRSRHLSLGYWGRPDLTEAAFSADSSDPGLRTYRTGDLGRLRPDGCLEFLGRQDGQLKVLGRRIEPAEIECHLLAMPGVLEAAVTTYPGRRGEGRLAAYLVVDGDRAEPRAIRKALAERLPASMVPATVMFVESLPLTASGKVDRAALAPVAETTAAGPRGPVETVLMEVWEGVLERGGFGVHDDFFELGGDSLAAAELLAALESRLGLPLSDSLVLRAPTIARLAAELGEAAGGPPIGGIVPLQPRGRGTPLVLVHGLDFSTNSYVWLVRALGAGRPVWGLDVGPHNWTSIEDLAEEHAAALRAARPGQSHLLAGFCSGAIVALEVARRLRAEGSEVPMLALIGIGAIDFPTLVSPSAGARYRAARRPLARVGRHLANGRGLDPRSRAVHLRDGVLAIVKALRTRAGRARRKTGRDPARGALSCYAPLPLGGEATLYLSAEATALYSDDPVRDWAGLADRTGVELLPGANDDLLREPMAGELAWRIRSAIEAAER